MAHCNVPVERSYLIAPADRYFASRGVYIYFPQGLRACVWIIISAYGSGELIGSDVSLQWL